jgi:hypothetical protein
MNNQNVVECIKIRFAICKVCEKSTNSGFKCSLRKGCCFGRWRANPVNQCPLGKWLSSIPSQEGCPTGGVGSSPVSVIPAQAGIQADSKNSAIANLPPLADPPVAEKSEIENE